MAHDVPRDEADAILAEPKVAPISAFHQTMIGRGGSWTMAVGVQTAARALLTPLRIFAERLIWNSKKPFVRPSM